MPCAARGFETPRELVLGGRADALPDVALIALLVGEEAGEAVLREHPIPDALWRASGATCCGVGNASGELQLVCDAKFLGKSLGSTTSSASYTSQNPLLAKTATLKTASAFTGLDAASGISVRRVKLTIEKNIETFYAFGSDTPASIHNTSFLVKGDMELLYNESTTRAYLVNSTNQAMRLTLANTGVTLGSAANPTIQFDLPATEDISRVEFREGLQRPLAAALEKRTGWETPTRTVRSLSSIADVRCNVVAVPPPYGPRP